MGYGNDAKIASQHMPQGEDKFFIFKGKWLLHFLFCGFKLCGGFLLSGLGGFQSCRGYLSEHYDLEDRILKHYPQEIKEYEERIMGYGNDAKIASQHMPQGEDKFCPMTLNGVTYKEKADAGGMLLAICKENPLSQPIQIGSYRGFQMEVFYDTVNAHYCLNLCGMRKYKVDLGTDALGNLTRIENEIAKLPARLHLRFFLIVLYYNTPKSAVQMCKLDLTLPVRAFFLCLPVVLLWLIVNNRLVFFIQIQFDIEGEIESLYGKYPKVLGVFDTETAEELTEEECAALIKVMELRNKLTKNQHPNYRYWQR